MSFENVDNVIPLSHTQKGMLYHCLQDSTHQSYIAQISFDIFGDLNFDKWMSAWSAVIQKHDALRASFMWDGLDEPLQVIHSTIKPEWLVISSATKCAKAVPKERTGFDQSVAEPVAANDTSINPSSSPLMRFSLSQQRANHWRCVWTVHHLLADGWSTPTIINDVLTHYSTGKCGEPATSYARYIAWQTSRDTNVARSWWLQELKDAVATPMHLPAATSISDKTEVTWESAKLPEETTSRIIEFCQSSKISLSSLIHAAWALTVSRYADNQSPLFGTTLSGRHVALNDIDRAVGLYITTVPLRVSIKPDMTVSALLEFVQRKISDLNEQDGIPLVELEKMITSEAGSAGFESIVVMESHNNDLKLTDKKNTIQISNIDYTTHSHYPLALLVHPGKKITLKLLYDNKRFSNDTADALLTYYTRLLTRLLAKGSSTIADCFAGYPPAHLQVEQPVMQPPVTSIHAWIRYTSEKNPNAIAIVQGDDAISYNELDRRSDELACYLNSKINRTGCGVGLFIPRSIHLFIGLLAILKSGNYYIPLDTEQNTSRIKQLLSLAGVDTVLHSNQKQTEAISGVKSILIESALEACSGSKTSALADERIEPDGDSLAYVMFTSGSTGTPKGVKVTHANLLYSTAARLTYYGGEPCRFLLLSVATFDSSVAGIYWSLCSGGTLVLPTNGEDKDIEKLIDVIYEQRVTHTLCLGSFYDLFLENQQVDRLRSLKTVVIAGEECRSATTKTHKKVLPLTALYNEYGPTEGTVWATVHRITAEEPHGLPSDVIPIGHAIPGARIDIVNESGDDCPNGCIGELVISGPGICAGYLNQDKDLADPFQPLNNQQERCYRTGDLGYRNSRGELVFVGRKDRQFKIRGHRIEPAEIENIISRHELVNESIVMSIGDEHIDSDAVLVTALNSLAPADADDLLQQAEERSKAQQGEAYDATG